MSFADAIFLTAIASSLGLLSLAFVLTGIVGLVVTLIKLGKL